MRIAIISNTDTVIPLAYTLATAGSQLQVCVFFSPPADGFIIQKVTAFATQLNIELTQQKNEAHLYAWLQAGNYDVCLMMGYSYLISLHRLKPWPGKIYNIHFGPLPAYKGPVPVFWQLKNGEKKVGVTIHEVNEKFDSGPIIWYKEVDNVPHYNYETVNQLLGQLSVEGAFFIMQLIANKMPLPVIKREGLKTAYYKRPRLADVLINWQEMSAAEICNLARAGNPWNKGAATFFNGQELKLLDAVIIDSPGQELPAGAIAATDGLLHICCSDGHLINVNMLFYANSYIPAYHAAVWGLVKGAILG